ncbi:MAG: endonuclease [Candidatus Yanofskybacteria bacterium RIFCSPHIGHO2_02_FULL_44_12b]|uniref:Endonuclease n=1 Tax=Candidatus Yanofskybacteria bacterium RIFCSPLOWO2_01_FULL_44_22 TaxID=1802697 RepID=A0A1F8GN93_9BACT|nr:MAG: endonuclease [Candidatus Yanofskybacteria bacterium RIFCSPHIGHO2_01_FULL_44_24]OGN15762.1 MAG: endonuclease [Candidatus Yanofskybacteria bacterium RIFCSPHIGHO2_02_FULL_44_12b]OGN26801.1 MAG: endonuclease [Candidatus Yanofskybacteria bacterium RIFCSPLOWO2_01_FULL_44_22]
MNMYFVYILKSGKDGNLYIGLTNNIERRLNEHNRGRNLSTKHRVPFKLLYQERVGSRIEARKREKYFKSGTGREWIKSSLR